MTRSVKQLDRKTIARTALALVDDQGLDALSMRRVAAELEVDPMTLYRSVPNREGMIRDIVALLLAEIEAEPRAGETWDQTLRRVHLSEREVALRHPHAYLLLVAAARDEEPVLSWTEGLMNLLAAGGLPRAAFFDVWLVDASYTNGFLMLETEMLRRAGGEDRPGAQGEFAKHLGETASGDSFVRGLDLIYRGLRDTITTASAGEGGARG